MANIPFSEVLALIEPLVDELRNFHRTGERADSARADGVIERMDAAVIALYTMAYTRSKKSERLDEAANVWADMFSFCARSLEALAESGLGSTLGGKKSAIKLAKTQEICGKQRDHLHTEHVALQRQFEEAGLLRPWL